MPVQAPKMANRKRKTEAPISSRAHSIETHKAHASNHLRWLGPKEERRKACAFLTGCWHPDHPQIGVVRRLVFGKTDALIDSHQLCPV